MMELGLETLEKGTQVKTSHKARLLEEKTSGPRLSPFVNIIFLLYIYKLLNILQIPFSLA